VVYLENPWLETRVKHNIKAKNFETHRVFDVIWLATFVNMCQLRLYRAYCLNYGLFNISLNLVYIVPLRLKVSPNISKGTFMAYRIIIFAFILYKLGAILIDSIVSKVHKEIIQVIVCRWYILFCSKSRQSFFVHIYPQRV